MAAGLGYIEFNTGDVLTAAQANGYLASQVVMVFADAAARTSAIASPQEGMISYLKDTNATQYYSGSAWVSIGGAGSPLTTKGDLYGYSTTDARVAIGTNKQVLTADSTAATGVAWAAGGLTKITSGTFSGASSFSVDNAFSATYDNYKMIVAGTDGGGTAGSVQIRFRTGGSDNTTSNYSGVRESTIYATGAKEDDTSNSDNKSTFGRLDTSGGFWLTFDIIQPFASQRTSALGSHCDTTRGGYSVMRFNATTSFDGIKILNQAGQNIAGSYSIYGYGN